MISPHVLHVREDEGFVDVKATGNDVLGILVSKTVGFLQTQVLPQKLFIIGQLDHQRHIKDVLKIPKGRQLWTPFSPGKITLLGEEERDEMAKVHGF